MAALVAAYALALQAVFTMLAPMQAQADGTVTVYCSGAGNSVSPDADGPAAPVTGMMSCVFCGACAGGFVILTGDASLAYRPVERPLSLARVTHNDCTVAIHVRDGPARAPPLSV